MYLLDLVGSRLTIRSLGTQACGLWLDDVCVGRFWSANDAAEAVARRQTGNADIDGAVTRFPRDVDGWRWISIRSGS